MGSKVFEGVWFISFAKDHSPPHVHGRHAGIQVIVELVDGEVRLARRTKNILPPNAKQSDITHILRTAAKHGDELMQVWRTMHG